MARIPENELARIKSEVSLLRLVESQGYAITRQGKDVVISCPFHEEDTPSCIISPKSNLFHCFGCEAAGSVIDWVMKTQGVSFRFACELLQKDIALVAQPHSKVTRDNTTTRLAAPLNEDADEQTALKQVINYYHATLKQSPEALDYLASRGLNHPDLIDTFTLGFANRTLGYRLPYKNRKAGSVLRGQLQAIGLLRASGHEHFNGSLVVPVINTDGVITEVYGRKLLGKRLRKGTPQHLYLPGAHAGVWNVSALAVSDEVILCEALIDAMTFWVNGFRNVTASYGANGFTDEHLQCFKQLKIKRVLIAYDRDAAGDAAAEKLASLLNDNGMDAYRVLLPKGMDVNEYAQQVKPAAKSLALVIRQAQWLGQGQAPAISTAAEPVVSVVLSDETVEPAPLEQEAPEDTEVLPLAAPALPAPSALVPPCTSAASVAVVDAEPVQRIPALPVSVDAEIKEHEILITLGERHYRVRGLDNNKGYEQLKIQLRVVRDDHFHIDKLDLYSSKQRQVFINQAGVELGVKDEVIKKDLGQVLLALETQQEKQAQAPASNNKELSDREQAQALELLRDPQLLTRILEDFTTAGVVGESTNKLVGYLACVSRKLDKPLAVMIQSSSAAGKSSLMDAVLNLMPEEERVQYSAMTGQSLFYMGETNLKNKILAIAEEEGVEQASYALKLLQSEGEITIASTGKDEATGSLVTKEYRVQGPVMLFLTTTAIDIDEELMNRCLVLTVNESREQTQAIHAMQRQQQTLEGLLKSEDKKQVLQRHQNAQRLLKSLLVVNPFAEQLTFIDDKTRTRRDHMKYLTLIKAIALLHQYQREIQTVTHQGEVLSYIEVTLDDIETANRLANEVLGRSLDELPPQTRTLLQQIYRMVTRACKAQGITQKDYHFSRRAVRDESGWTDFQIKKHMTRLQDMEYVLVHRGGRGQSFVYELLYEGEGENGEPFLLGLSSMKKQGYDEKKKPLNEKKEPSASNKEPPSSPQVAAKAPHGSMDKDGAMPMAARVGAVAPQKRSENALQAVQ